MAITPLPTPPAITDTPAEFNTKAFNWVDALDTFTTEANALAVEVDQDAQDVAAAALDAAEIETIWGQMNAVFLGGKTSDPALDNEGNPLVNGATYYNTATDTLRAYNAGNWYDTGTAIPITLTLDEFNGTGAQTAFTLSVAPGSASSVRVAISGVLKRPLADYTVSGTTLTFAVAPASGTNNISCLTTTPVQVGVPTDDTVSTAKIQDGAVTLAKMQDIATARILGRVTAGTGDAEELTGAQVTSLLSAATTSAQGAVELATESEIQTGTDTGRVPSVDSMRKGLIVLGTPTATTSGSSVPYTGIPAWAKRVNIFFDGVSLSGTDELILLIGDAGGLENSGYISTVAGLVESPTPYIGNRSTTDFRLTVNTGSGAATWSGKVSIELMDTNTNTWVCQGMLVRSDNDSTYMTAGAKSLSGVLTQLAVDTNGTNAFDAGKINISYE